MEDSCTEEKFDEAEEEREASGIKGFLDGLKMTIRQPQVSVKFYKLSAAFYT